MHLFIVIDCFLVALEKLILHNYNEWANRITIVSGRKTYNVGIQLGHGTGLTL